MFNEIILADVKRDDIEHNLAGIRFQLVAGHEVAGHGFLFWSEPGRLNFTKTDELLIIY